MKNELIKPLKQWIKIYLNETMIKKNKTPSDWNG